jgi:hypothetical protein
MVEFMAGGGLGIGEFIEMRQAHKQAACSNEIALSKLAVDLDDGNLGDRAGKTPDLED